MVFFCELSLKYECCSTFLMSCPHCENCEHFNQSIFLVVLFNINSIWKSQKDKVLNILESSKTLQKGQKKTTFLILCKNLFPFLALLEHNDFNVTLTGCLLKLDHLKSTFSLMKKRNDNMRQQLYGTSNNLMATERPRSSRYGLDWRMSLAETEEDQEAKTWK